MKLKYSIAYIAIFTFFQIYAQKETVDTTHKNYEFNTPIKMEGADIKNDSLEFDGNDSFEYSLEGQRLQVILTDNEYVYIRFFNYRQKMTTNKLNQAKYVDDGSSKYFRVKKEVFENTTDKIYPIYAGETFGLVSIPFKIRIGDDDFETNANIGLNLGFKYRLNRKIKDRWILQPNIGIGLADIPLNEENSNVEKAENRTALSFSLGLMLNVSNDVNIGVFYGVDRLNKANQSVQWQYQDKGWLGIGINIGFGNRETESRDNDPVNKSSN